MSVMLSLSLSLLLLAGTCACQDDDDDDDAPDYVPITDDETDDLTEALVETASDDGPAADAARPGNSSAAIQHLLDDMWAAYERKLAARRRNASGAVLGRARLRTLVLESVINRTAGVTGLSSQDARRMTVIQVTFAIMISVLLVADIFLAWSLSYLVVHYEKRGRVALRYYRALVNNH